MAQKETSSKSRRWLGLSGAAVLVANLVLTGTTIAFQQEGEVNHALGIEGAGASYGGTEFSADGTLSDASYEKYIEAAYQFCEQEEEEGSVLLYNRNNALPLSESERNVTVFGRGSIDPVFRSTAGGSSTNPDYQKTPVDALQDAGFNVNQTVLDAYASAEAPKERSVSSVGEYDPALFTGSVTDSFASYGDVAFVTLSRFATEGNDLAMVNDKGKRMLELDDNEKAIFQQIKDSGKFKKTVVLLNSVFAMEMDWLDEYNVDAVLWVGNPGFYGMPGAIRVVTGEVNPSGHTTATFAANSLSAPSAETSVCTPTTTAAKRPARLATALSAITRASTSATATTRPATRTPSSVRATPIPRLAPKPRPTAGTTPRRSASPSATVCPTRTMSTALTSWTTTATPTSLRRPSR